MANFVFVGRSNNRYYIETQHSVNTVPLHISICGNGNRTDFLCRYSLIGIGKTLVSTCFHLYENINIIFYGDYIQITLTAFPVSFHDSIALAQDTRTPTARPIYLFRCVMPSYSEMIGC